jgi:hypothetical protein
MVKCKYVSVSAPPLLSKSRNTGCHPIILDDITLHLMASGNRSLTAKVLSGCVQNMGETSLLPIYLFGFDIMFE